MNSLADYERKIAALARLIYELDDIARCDKRWGARRRLKRLKAAIELASELATQPDLADRIKKILDKRTVL